MIDEIKRQGKPYGLYFDDIQGGFTLTGRASPQAFQVLPVMVYRVYADGRPDELFAESISWGRLWRRLRKLFLPAIKSTCLTAFAARKGQRAGFRGGPGDAVQRNRSTERRQARNARQFCLRRDLEHADLREFGDASRSCSSSYAAGRQTRRCEAMTSTCARRTGSFSRSVQVRWRWYRRPSRRRRTPRLQLNHRPLPLPHLGRRPPCLPIPS